MTRFWPRTAAAASCAPIWSRQIRVNPRNEGRAVHKAVAGMAQVICWRKRPCVLWHWARSWRLLFQLSGARAEPPPLAGSPEAWLEGAERLLRANTGRLLVLVSGNGATTVYAVIHAPLAAVWIFGAPPPATEVLALGKISGRLVGTGAFITVTWNDGSLNTLVWPDALPDLALVAGRCR